MGTKNRHGLVGVQKDRRDRTGYPISNHRQATTEEEGGMMKTSELIELAKKPVHQLSNPERQALLNARDKLFDGLPQGTTFGQAIEIKAREGDELAKWIIAHNRSKANEC
jgi:hypothetical protein